MPKVSKAYILRIDDPISIEYAKVCAESCDKVGLEWEYFAGFQDIKARQAWRQTGIKLSSITDKLVEQEAKISKAEVCSAGHANIWKTVAEGEHEAVIILEHDAVMLHNIDLDIPDGVIVALGYKLANIEKYNHIAAGPPKKLTPIKGHEGAHAYALTKKTARGMIEEIEANGRPLAAVDNAYFIKNQRKTKYDLMIADPTPAIGWLRESTIWKKSALRNEPFIESFKSNLSR